MSTITEAHIGQKATFKGGKGIIRYVGETEFAEGVWVGLELAVPKGVCCYLQANVSVSTGFLYKKLSMYLYVVFVCL